MLGHVEQRLRLIFEMAGDHQRAGVPDAQALLGEIESAGDGQRGRGENHGIHDIEQVFGQQGRDIDGRGLQKDAPAAPLHPEDVGLVVAFQDELEGLAELDGAARRGMISTGGVFSSFR